MIQLPAIPPDFNQQTEPVVMTIDDQINSAINCAMDSVYVINKELSQEFFNKDSFDLINRNVEHLKIVLDSDDIKNSGKDLSTLQLAVDNGTLALEYISNNTVTNLN